MLIFNLYMTENTRLSMLSSPHKGAYLSRPLFSTGAASTEDTISGAPGIKMSAAASNPLNGGSSLYDRREVTLVCWTSGVNNQQSVYIISLQGSWQTCKCSSFRFRVLFRLWLFLFVIVSNCRQRNSVLHSRSHLYKPLSPVLQHRYPIRLQLSDQLSSSAHQL